MPYRLWVFLRSRRAASYLLVYLTVFFWVGTLLPFGGPESAAVTEWAARNPGFDRIVGPLGMYNPYTTPWFLVPALWLAVSTCACAVERTMGAVRTYRSRGLLAEADIHRLEATPTARFTARDLAAEESLAHAEGALKALRMRVRRGPAALTADSRALGLAGSPLFHIALGLLFVFATLGWLTRWEGGFYALRDRPVTEVESSYLPGWSKGLLFGDGHTGYTFTVTEVISDYSIDDVSVGTAARVRVSDGDVVIAEDLVHTNRPMRFGSTMVHHLNGRSGLAMVFSVSSSATVQPLEAEVVFKDNPESPRGVDPWIGMLSLTQGGEVPLSIEPRPEAKVAVTMGGLGDEPEKVVVLAQGESAPFPGGAVFTVEDLTRYAELWVVHDWSVPVLYLMFVLASLGAAITVSFPFRRVHIKLFPTDPDDASVIACVVRAQKSDPAFKLKVIEALEAHGFERID